MLGATFNDTVGSVSLFKRFSSDNDGSVTEVTRGASLFVFVMLSHESCFVRCVLFFVSILMPRNRPRAALDPLIRLHWVHGLES